MEKVVSEANETEEEDLEKIFHMNKEEEEDADIDNQ
jgi:hypothetical protein